MTAKEALEIILGFKPYEDTLEKPLCDLRIVELLPDESDALKQAITPPTADEVCKTLSEYFNLPNVTYRNGAFYEHEGFHIVTKTCEGNISFNHFRNVTPRLITLIGRFYEEQEKEEQLCLFGLKHGAE